MAAPIDTSRTVSFDLGKEEVAGLWKAAILFIVLGIASIGMPFDLGMWWRGHQADQRDALLITSLGAVLCLIGGQIALRTRKLRRNVLTLSQEGIEERRKVRGFVPWRAVQKIEYDGTGDGIVLHIWPEFEDKLQIPESRYCRISRAGMRITLAPCATIDLKELHELCMAYLHAARHGD